MNLNETLKETIPEREFVRNTADDIAPIKLINRLLPFVVLVLILAVLIIYTHIQRRDLVHHVEDVTNQIADYMAGTIANEIGYAQSSIKLSAVTIAQTMTSDTLDNPSDVILPMIENTPFDAIEYIRADGMNVMNIGEPFDASDRVYYIEGIKGNTGIWNNYHPKTSQETLMNFYTPLVYQGNTVGVITGYIGASSQVAPLFETELYGKNIIGLLVDENNMVICSSLQSEYVKDFSLDMFLDCFGIAEEQKEQTYSILDKATDMAVSYKDPTGEGRICVVTVPETNWKVAIVVPDNSFSEIIGDDTKESVVAIGTISIFLIAYATYVLLRNVKRRRLIAAENAKLEEENRLFNEEKQKAFNAIAEIRDIIASANMGTWRIELVEGKEPRMYVDDTMKKLMGVAGSEHSPEQTYMDWFANIMPEAVDSVLHSVERMEQGHFDENTYLWIHPTKGARYVRCGGTAVTIPGGYSLKGYHYDVDDVVREDQAKVVMLQDALNEKNEYYSTLGTLGGIFYSMHVIDLLEDTAIEFNAKNEVKAIVNQKQGATNMMIKVMSAVTAEEHKQSALEFTDLSTLAERMRNKKILSKQLIGNRTGWFLASFVTMEQDEEGRPTKVIYTTRVIDDEKKQEERLIKESQTDELTGMLNRHAYEDDIYIHDNIPKEDNFVYVSLDVNGLKIVNDTKGHMAGDELLMGAAECMKTCLGTYGKLYRVGGDEFVAILFCNNQKLQSIFRDFDETIDNWSGLLIDSLSISYGWASKAENAGATVRELSDLADQRMYESKANHYKKAGLDRRGQKDAHKVLCQLYTKILKINLTDDTYQIVDMDVNEQTDEKGFSHCISKWLENFGTSGQVHPDDLPEYLEKTNLSYMKEYFGEDKTSLHIFYRRKYGEEFKQVMMEIIPASDYSVEQQTLFLYVKDIDK